MLVVMLVLLMMMNTASMMYILGIARFDLHWWHVYVYIVQGGIYETSRWTRGATLWSTARTYYPYASLVNYVIYDFHLVNSYCVKHLVKHIWWGDHIQQTGCNQTSTNFMEPNNLHNMDSYISLDIVMFHRANPTSNQSGPRKPSIKTTRLEEGDFYFITVSLKLYQHQSKSKNNLSKPWDTRIISPLPHRQRGKVIGSVHDN
jgi:hypothetical protein